MPVIYLHSSIDTIVGVLYNVTLQLSWII